ncbi:glycine cleavage T-protein (aminomethyl transferase) domain-containing protein [Besnoitia besnoiti]|uniref:Glycine cleavage T-protein (Aminomethyl transferase) domain-containing protein n=1 Tax=Besnoitia besnoiti TaxID=94643 RepID=A0A2A9MAR8_BESBE|nr:glycine cleavage T-protein (aminomethyl transferase) domain-containing protein [Besnoitia besnoiti]PFH33401.1 glycine cleavage T-protein (aminomethyl transferase) domain-containing protein [Besnoitia besnoiti]
MPAQVRLSRCRVFAGMRKGRAPRCLSLLPSPQLAVSHAVSRARLGAELQAADASKRRSEWDAGEHAPWSTCSGGTITPRRLTSSPFSASQAPPSAAVSPAFSSASTRHPSAAAAGVVFSPASRVALRLSPPRLSGPVTRRIAKRRESRSFDLLLRRQENELSGAAFAPPAAAPSAPSSVAPRRSAAASSGSSASSSSSPSSPSSSSEEASLRSLGVESRAFLRRGGAWREPLRGVEKDEGENLASRAFADRALGDVESEVLQALRRAASQRRASDERLREDARRRSPARDERSPAASVLLQTLAGEENPEPLGCAPGSKFTSGASKDDGISPLHAPYAAASHSSSPSSSVLEPPSASSSSSSSGSLVDLYLSHVHRLRQVAPPPRAFTDLHIKHLLLPAFSPNALAPPAHPASPLSAVEDRDAAREEELLDAEATGETSDGRCLLDERHAEEGETEEALPPREEAEARGRRGRGRRLQAPSQAAEEGLREGASRQGESGVSVLSQAAVERRRSDFLTLSRGGSACGGLDDADVSAAWDESEDRLRLEEAQAQVALERRRKTAEKHAQILAADVRVAGLSEVQRQAAEDVEAWLALHAERSHTDEANTEENRPVGAAGVAAPVASPSRAAGGELTHDEGSRDARAPQGRGGSAEARSSLFEWSADGRPAYSAPPSSLPPSVSSSPFPSRPAEDVGASCSASEGRALGAVPPSAATGSPRHLASGEDFSAALSAPSFVMAAASARMRDRLVCAVYPRNRSNEDFVLPSSVSEQDAVPPLGVARAEEEAEAAAGEEDAFLHSAFSEALEAAAQPATSLAAGEVASLGRRRREKECASSGLPAGAQRGGGDAPVGGDAAAAPRRSDEAGAGETSSRLARRRQAQEEADARRRTEFDVEWAAKCAGLAGADALHAALDSRVRGRRLHGRRSEGAFGREGGEERRACAGAAEVREWESPACDEPPRAPTELRVEAREGAGGRGDSRGLRRETAVQADSPHARQEAAQTVGTSGASAEDVRGGSARVGRLERNAGERERQEEAEDLDVEGIAPSGHEGARQGAEGRGRRRSGEDSFFQDASSGVPNDPFEATREIKMNQPLVNFWREKGAATFGLYNECQLPLTTKLGALAAYRATRESAAVFDVSFRRVWLVHGRDRLAVLDMLLSCDLERGMKVGDAQYAALLDSKGLILDDCFVAKLSRHVEVWLSGAAPAHCFDFVAQFINYCRQSGLDVSLAPLPSAACCIALQGPRAFEILADRMQRFSSRSLSLHASPRAASAAASAAAPAPSPAAASLPRSQRAAAEPRGEAEDAEAASASCGAEMSADAGDSDSARELDSPLLQMRSAWQTPLSLQQLLEMPYMTAFELAIATRTQPRNAHEPTWQRATCLRLGSTGEDGIEVSFSSPSAALAFLKLLFDGRTAASAESAASSASALPLPSSAAPSLSSASASVPALGCLYALDMLRMESGLARMGVDVKTHHSLPQASLCSLLSLYKVRRRLLLSYEAVQKQFTLGASVQRVGILVGKPERLSSVAAWAREADDTRRRRQQLWLALRQRGERTSAKKPRSPAADARGLCSPRDAEKGAAEPESDEEDELRESLLAVEAEAARGWRAAPRDPSRASAALLGASLLVPKIRRRSSLAEKGQTSGRETYAYFPFHGCSILSNPHRRPIGVVTSCAWSPHFKCRLAQGLILREFAKHNQALLIAIPMPVPEHWSARRRGRALRSKQFRCLVTAKVHRFPFVPHNYPQSERDRARSIERPFARPEKRRNKQSLA